MRVQDCVKALVCTVCYTWVDHKDKRSLQSSPEPREAVLRNNIAGSVKNVFPLRYGGGLLSGCKYGDGYSKNLSEGTCYSA